MVPQPDGVGVVDRGRRERLERSGSPEPDTPLGLPAGRVRAHGARSGAARSDRAHALGEYDAHPRRSSGSSGSGQRPCGSHRAFRPHLPSVCGTPDPRGFDRGSGPHPCRWGRRASAWHLPGAKGQLLHGGHADRGGFTRLRRFSARLRRDGHYAHAGGGGARGRQGSDGQPGWRTRSAVRHDRAHHAQRLDAR